MYTKVVLNSQLSPIFAHQLWNNFMKHNIITLANGIRVLHTYIPYTRAVHCGFVLHVGSRDDGQQPGMAHFLEHILFKGTARRKTFHILNYLESVGGDLNAYTTKEKLCLYASLAAEYAGRATELLTDITFGSVFPEKEIEKEKQVISEEIDMYRNVPDEAIFEDFDELIFPGHELGHPILGSKQSIHSIRREDIQAFVGRHFSGDRIVYSIVGNVTEKQVTRLVDKYLRPLQLPAPAMKRTPPPPLQAQIKSKPIATNQTHEILGGRSYPFRNRKYIPFLLVNNLLGGNAMNSRLNLNIREKYGLTYNISSFFSPYTDSGAWGVYFACEPTNHGRVRRLVMRELRKLREQKVGVLRLNQAKKQLCGQLTLSYENLLTQMLSNAKELLTFGEVVPFPTYLSWVEAVKAEDLLEVANELYQPEAISIITYEGNTRLNGHSLAGEAESKSATLTSS
ncbi:MAG: insulinase family protein [Bacteroidetes bacterium]|nr:MAG: insulinase family protein [Bacteroidota bacterium]